MIYVKNNHYIYYFSPTRNGRKSRNIYEKGKKDRSELFREALRRYFEEQEWKEVMRYGQMKAKETGIREEQIEDIVDADRT